MKGKIFLGFLSLAIAVVFLPAFAAFEAHVINVTAKIENALSVNTNSLDFGTVFPQEHLDKPMAVSLSESFLDAGQTRVDNVEYFIRQKPKCAITSEEGTQFDSQNTATGHIILGDDPGTPEIEDETHYRIDCGEAPRELGENETWGVLPSLCEYISKEDDNTPNNDETLPSFHHPWKIFGGDNPNTPGITEEAWIRWKDADGILSKNSPQDTVDNWTIDLAVPCFGGQCAQDWEEFVLGINPQAIPAEFVQPQENRGKIMGCDLWVEVSGVTTDAV